MLTTICLIIFSLGILVLSAEVLINTTKELAGKTGISPLVVGTTIVACGTSLPELVVSVAASLEGQPEIAIANVVGSNITNLALVFGLSILAGKLRIGTTKTQVNGWVMLFATFLFILASLLFAPIPKTIGVLWMVLYFSFLIWGITAGVHGREGEDKKWFKKSQSFSVSLRKRKLILLPLSFFGLTQGGDLFVRQVVKLGQYLKVSNSFLGFTLVALGTSFPELMTSLVGVSKKEIKLVEGNILGSNITNILLIAGLSSFLSPISFRHFYMMIFLILATTLTFLSIVLNKGKVVSRGWGLLLFCLYLAYLLRAYQIK